MRAIKKEEHKMFKNTDKETINTICNILGTAIAAASLIVSIVSCQTELEQKSQPELPVSTETNTKKDTDRLKPGARQTKSAYADYRDKHNI